MAGGQSRRETSQMDLHFVQSVHGFHHHFWPVFTHQFNIKSKTAQHQRRKKGASCHLLSTADMSGKQPKDARGNLRTDCDKRSGNACICTVQGEGERAQGRSKTQCTPEQGFQSIRLLKAEILSKSDH